MRYNELVKKIEAAGWKLLKSGKSSLRVYEKNGRIINLHYHGNQEVATGMANKILKDAGLK